MALICLQTQHKLLSRKRQVLRNQFPCKKDARPTKSICISVKAKEQHQNLIQMFVSWLELSNFIELKRACTSLQFFFGCWLNFSYRTRSWLLTEEPFKSQYWPTEVLRITLECFCHPVPMWINNKMQKEMFCVQITPAVGR